MFADRKKRFPQKFGTAWTPTPTLPQDTGEGVIIARSSQMRQDLLAEELEALHRLGAARTKWDAASND
jgi:hypothetical protein